MNIWARDRGLLFKNQKSLQKTPTDHNHLFWTRVRVAFLVLNTPIATNRACTKPAKQSLEKSVIYDIRSPLKKFNPSQVSHFSTASGLPLTLLHITNKREIFNTAPIPHK